MELSEAKKILKDWLEYNRKNKNVLREADTIIDVQETILKALDNSISKDKIKEIIYPTPENYVPIEVQTSDMYIKLQELLGE